MANKTLFSLHHLARYTQQHGSNNIMLYNIAFRVFLRAVAFMSHDGVLKIKSTSKITRFDRFDHTRTSNGMFEYLITRQALAHSRHNDSFYTILVLPDTIEADFNAFICQNKTKLGKWANIDCDNMVLTDLMLFAYVQSNKSPNLVSWIMQNVVVYNSSIVLINHVVNWAMHNPSSVKLLSKNSLTAYNKPSLIEELYDETRNINLDKVANNTIQMFNTTQKKVLKSMCLTSGQKAILGKFNRLSLVKQNNFVRKMSSINEGQEIFRQLSVLVKDHFNWNVASLLEFIAESQDLHCNIVYNVGNILLLEVLDYDTIKFVCKATNWCISKNKKYWDQYIGRNQETDAQTKQYVLFNFNKREDADLSIVGFTVAVNKGIVASHSFTNKPLWGSVHTRSKKCFDPKFTHIFKILSASGIDVNKFIYNNDYILTINPNINKNTIWEHISNIMADAKQYTILRNDDKIVVKFNTPDMLKMFHWEAENLIDITSAQEYWLFFDPTKHTDLNKQWELIACVRSNIYIAFDCFGLKERPRAKELDVALLKYGIPLSVIKRTPNESLTLLLESCDNYDIETVGNLLQDKQFVDALCKMERNNEGFMYLSSTIVEHIINHKTLDVFDEFVKHHIPMSSIMRRRSFSMLCTMVVQNLLRELCKDPLKLIDEEPSVFFAKLNTDDIKPSSACFYGSYYVFKTIMQTCNWTAYQDVLIKCLTYISDLPGAQGVKQLLINLIIPHIKYQDIKGDLLNQLYNILDQYHHIDSCKQLQDEILVRHLVISPTHPIKQQAEQFVVSFDY